MRYDPFRTRFHELSAKDLLVLRDVAEGWYVEYKSKDLPAKTLAKSLSAFANHYGGWLFIGIEEAKDGSRTASAFPGITNSEIPRIELALREASRTCTSPPVYFEHRVVSGSDESPHLPRDRSVVVVRIPQGANPPYVHIDGKIYRRIADSSEPKPDTDRATLDQLWERGRRARKQLRRRALRRPELSKAESSQPFVHLFVSHDPYERSRAWLVRDFGQFAVAMDRDPIPFTHLFAHSEGYVARQEQRGGGLHRSLTWEFDHRGHSFVTIPLSCTRGDAKAFLSDFRYGPAFWDELRRRNMVDATLIDVSMLSMVICAVCTRHRALLHLDGVHGPFFAKAQLENIWRCVPFLDTEPFAAFAKKHGPPLAQQDHALAPPGVDLSTFAELSHDVSPDIVEAQADLTRTISSGMGLATHILRGLGIPMEPLMDSAHELYPAFDRARSIYMSRAQRD